MRTLITLLVAVLASYGPVLSAALDHNKASLPTVSLNADHPGSDEITVVQRKDEATEGQDRAALLHAVDVLRREASVNADQIIMLRWQVGILMTTLLLLLAGLALRRFILARRTRILSMTDALTGLPNRQHILTFLGTQAKFAYETEQPLSIIMMELDRLKGIQNEGRYELGGAALKTIADIANQALRRGDRVGRLAGGKFLAVLPGTAGPSAIEIAERMRRSIETSQVGIAAGDLALNVSLGVCEWKAGRESMDALVKRADKTLREIGDKEAIDR